MKIFGLLENTSCGLQINKVSHIETQLSRCGIYLFEGLCKKPHGAAVGAAG